MAYAFVQQVENGLAVNAASAAVSITATAGNCIIVVSSQHPSSTPTITDTIGNVYISVAGGGIFSNGLFAYVCQNTLGGANTITTHSNSTNLAGVAAWEYSGLTQGGGILGSAFLGQNGPGAGANTITAGTFAVNVTPAMIFGIASDYQAGGNLPTAGTSPIAFTGRTAFWGGNPGGTHAIAEDARVVSNGSFGSTFGPGAGSANIFVSYGIAIAELGAGIFPVPQGARQTFVNTETFQY